MAVGNGGSAMGFSQEVVQEFQIATVNFDLTTGLTNGAAINVITRSGSNDLHGTAFYFFRDHTLAAYPALNRDPANPDPVFPAAAIRLCPRRPHPARPGLLLRQLRAQRAAGSRGDDAAGAGVRSPKSYHPQPVFRQPAQPAAGRPPFQQRTRPSSATRTMASGPSGRRRISRVRTRRPGRDSRSGPTRASWVSPASSATRWSMISASRTLYVNSSATAANRAGVPRLPGSWRAFNHRGADRPVYRSLGDSTTRWPGASTSTIT